MALIILYAVYETSDFVLGGHVQLNYSVWQTISSDRVREAVG